MKLCGLIDLPSLYLSGYILNNRNEYYKRLRNVTENNDWGNWIMYILDMIEITAQKGSKKIVIIEKLMSEMGEQIRKKLPKIYSKDLLEILFRLPYTKRNLLESAGLGNIKTSGNYLKNLEDSGFLKSIQVGKEKLYLNNKLMEVLKS